MSLTEAWTQQNTKLVSLKRSQYVISRRKHREKGRMTRTEQGVRNTGKTVKCSLCVFAVLAGRERCPGAEEIPGEIKLIKGRLNCTFRYLNKHQARKGKKNLD